MVITFKSKWDYIKENYTDFELFSRYIPNLVIGKKIKSPLREDKHPSFVVYNNRNGLYFIDLARPDHRGNIVDFIRIKENLNAFDAIDFIFNNLKSVKKAKPLEFKEKIKSQIYYNKIPFSEIHKNFWKPYGISSTTLDFYNVFAISSFYLNNDVTFKNHMYAFKIGSRVKIYMPYNNPKYLGNTNKNSIQGYTQINENPELIITSSLKEVMVLHEIGINAIAPNSENTVISEKILNPLLQKYKCFILYDNDSPGKKASELHSNLYNIPQINLDYNSKDLSDFVKNTNIQELKKLIHDSKALCGLWNPS